MNYNYDNLKEIATDFLKLCASGKAHIAFPKYISSGFKHHNIHFKGDAESLMTAMDENAKQFPDKAISIINIVQDKNIVVIHSHVVHHKKEAGYALVHIFRFENDKIDELWDLAQEVPSDSLNENGMF